VKAVHVLTTLQIQASDALHGDPKGMMYKETIATTEGHLETSTWLQSKFHPHKLKDETAVCLWAF
jgi:hypothetical protein